MATTLDIDDTYLYGLYTVVTRGGAVRSELHGVEWALGVDATVPNVEIISPVDTPTPSQNSAGVTVTYVADDILVTPRYLSGPGLVSPWDVFEDVPTEFILSGLNRTECSIDGGAYDRCFSGETHVLTQPDGVKVINVRSFDDAASNVPDGGLVSNLTDDVDGDGRDGVVDVILAIDPPESDIELTGGTPGGAVTGPQLLEPGDAGASWYRVAPGMRIFNYSSAAPSAATPYVYRFDNGAERGCENHALPYDDTPPDCVLTGTEVDDLLSTGGHSIHSTAVNETGNRYRDDTDLTTASPMDRQPVYIDTEDPFVEFTTIPLEEDETFGGNPWFGEQVVPFVSALDQFGGSGVTSIGYRFGLVGGYTPFDINNPPPVPSGENVFCYQVFDLAGNETSDCEDIREDGDVPTVNLDTVGGTLGDGSESGWWVGAPAFEANTYDDDVPTGVGIDSGHFRTRVDNGSVFTCNAPTCGFGGGLTTGTHLVHVAAIDRFGNLSGESTEEVLVDLEPPLIAPVIGPADPDGENGWWHTGPYLTLFADDPGDGSGVDPATLEYSLDRCRRPMDRLDRARPRRGRRAHPVLAGLRQRGQRQRRDGHPLHVVLRRPRQPDGHHRLAAGSAERLVRRQREPDSHLR